jgi:hypothetical protein
MFVHLRVLRLSGDLDFAIKPPVHRGGPSGRSDSELGSIHQMVDDAVDEIKSFSEKTNKKSGWT